MTEAPAIETQTTTVPLGEHELACQLCGVATPVKDGQRVTRLKVTVPRSPVADAAAAARGLPRQVGEQVSVMATTCSACILVQARAVQLHLRHPTLSARLGVGQDREICEAVVAALVGMVVAGIPLPERDAFTTAGLARMVRRWVGPGRAAMWSGVVTPTTVGSAATTPWSAVPEGVRQTLRTSRAELLRTRVARSAADVSIPLPPIGENHLRGINMIVPVQQGCLLCGVAHLIRPAVEAERPGGRAAVAEELWTARSSVSPEALGGRHGPHLVTGFTCPDCTDAVDRIGAIGLTAAERALLIHLGLDRAWHPDLELDGVVAYGGLVSDADRPDALRGAQRPAMAGRPWAHMGTEDELRRRLAKLLRVRIDG